MRYIYVGVLLLAGCVTMSPEAKMVRTITPGVAVAQNCKHLGAASVFAPALEGGMNGAQVKIRNKVAAAGGNAMVVTNQQSDYNGGADIQADAYRCPTQG
jgi:hypothetical protein